MSDTLAAVLKSEPEWRLLPAKTPPPIRRLLRRCLEKDPRRRLQAIGEARLLLEDFLAGRLEPEPAIAPAATRTGRQSLLLVAGVVAVAAV
nr:hypothetical protein [Desulfuromonadales bacterium]